MVTVFLNNNSLILQLLPYDGPATGFTQYFGIWGLNSTSSEVIKAEPWTEIWTVKEDGSGVTVDTDGQVIDADWDTPTTNRHSGLGFDFETTYSVVAPNVVRIVYVAKSEGITDMQTVRFTELGIQVSLL